MKPYFNKYMLISRTYLLKEDLSCLIANEHELVGQQSSISIMCWIGET